MSQPTLCLWASRAARKQTLASILAKPCQYRRHLHTSHFGTPIVANQQHSLPTSRQSAISSRSRNSLTKNKLLRDSQRSAFSTTAQKKATNVLTNPRVDDDGNPLRIEISERAAKVRVKNNLRYILLRCSCFCRLSCFLCDNRRPICLY